MGETRLAEVAAEDWRRAGLDDAFRALLEYAEALTRSPGASHRDNVARLRETGWDDEAILHACEVVSYFNFVNRMADGLGVALEADWAHPILGSRQVAGPQPNDRETRLSDG